MAEHYFGITDAGKQRENNEDTFITESVMDNKLIVACVIDGVGGYEGGEVAAALAKDSILDYLKNNSGDIREMMLASFVLANEKIYEEKSKNSKNKSMACVLTLAMVDVENNKFHYAHVGDTRLYLLRDHTLVKITKDQSFVGFLEDSGRLTENAAMTHPKRNEINKALGFNGIIPQPADYIETGESPFLPGDLIMLCSDGLTDMIGSNDIKKALVRANSLEEKGSELVKAANNAGGRDNITVVIVQNSKTPLKLKATKPVALKKNDRPSGEKPEKEPQESIGVKPAIKRRGRGGLIVFLTLLSLVFLGGFLWMWWQQRNQTAIPVQSSIVQPNEQEINLQNLINTSASDTIIITDSLFGKTIFLSDTVQVDRDTLYITGNGSTSFVRDSSFKIGTALSISENSKHIMLDGLIFQDFNLAILAANSNAVILRNTRFRNCAIAIGYRFPYTDTTTINGSFLNIQMQKDTIPQIIE
jgi:serine/threonine protein phosphatase PrpC